MTSERTEHESYHVEFEKNKLGESVMVMAPNPDCPYCQAGTCMAGDIQRLEKHSSLTAERLTGTEQLLRATERQRDNLYSALVALNGATQAAFSAGLIAPGGDERFDLQIVSALDAAFTAITEANGTAGGPHRDCGASGCLLQGVAHYHIEDGEPYCRECHQSLLLKTSQPATPPQGGSRADSPLLAAARAALRDGDSHVDKHDGPCPACDGWKALRNALDQAEDHVPNPAAATSTQARHRAIDAGRDLAQAVDELLLGHVPVELSVRDQTRLGTLTAAFAEAWDALEREGLV